MIRIYERSDISRFTFGGIAVDGTSGAEMNLMGSGNDQRFHSGVLRGLAVSCDSTDFSVSIRTHDSALQDTPDEIYKAINIDRSKRESDLFIGWVNRDTPIKGSLYLTLINDDSSVVSGLVSIELHNDIPRRFTR